MSPMVQLMVWSVIAIVPVGGWLVYRLVTESRNRSTEI